MIGHSAIGLGLGLATANPAVALAAGVVSHHLADWLPHFDIGTLQHGGDKSKHRLVPVLAGFTRSETLLLLLDIALTVAFVILLFPLIPREKWTLISLAIIGANLPDLVHNVPFWNQRLLKFRWIRWWREKIHVPYHTTVAPQRWLLGALPQLAVILYAIYLVLEQAL